MKTPFSSMALGLHRPAAGQHRLLVAVVAGLLPVTAVAAGETVPCPEKKAGQWYRFAKSDLYGIKTTQRLAKIESVEGDRLVINEDGVTLVTDRMHNWYQLGKAAATPKYYRVIECPFSLGEKRVYQDVDWDMGGWRARSTFTVTVDQELVPVTVKAGSFKAVRITVESRFKVMNPHNSVDVGLALAADSGTQQRVSWYVPELGTWVKSDALTVYPWGPQTARERERLELVDYSRGD